MKPEAKRYDVRTDLKGLLIVVFPSGVKSHSISFAFMVFSSCSDYPNSLV